LSIYQQLLDRLRLVSTFKGKARKRTCIAHIIIISTTKRSDVDHTELAAGRYTTSAFSSYKHSL